MLSNNIKPRLKVVPTKYSQSTPTQQHIYSEEEPCSPTESTHSFISSVSWVAEKSASELGTLLKSAYKSLREKEKNLLLAAEIGKSLLEHNQNLKQDYTKLLENVKHCENITKTEEYDNNMRLISSKKAYDLIIESLEKKNSEIQSLLEQTQYNSTISNQQYEKSKRKLEAEIEILKENLDIAGNKILELEENNQKKQEKFKKMDKMREFESRQNKDDLHLLEELTVKMQELYIENKQLQSSKKLIEEKLIVSLNDLEKLQENFEHFELTHQGYNNLQEAFERQTNHINELNSSLEDHRQILSKLKDKSSYSSHHSYSHSNHSNSCYHQQSLMGELENAFQSSSSTFNNNNSGRRRSKSQSSSISSSSSASSTISKMMDLASITERNLTSFYNAPGDYALEKLLSSIGIDDRNILNDTESLLSSDYLFEPETNRSFDKLNLYPTHHHHSFISSQLLRLEEEQHQKPGGFTDRILFHIRSIFRSLFRWCRFAIVMVTAVLINLWKGPDLLIEK